MARARRAAIAALVLVVSLGSVAVGAVSDSRSADAARVASEVQVVPAPLAAVPWPPSGSILVAEVVTGGASASDEYVELTNAGPGPVDLAGLELAYVTSSGSTVTRKATWPTTLALDPGQHLLVANAAGTFAGLADATYTGGFAATGGALVIRPIGGTAIDAVGWGDATNAFVEGSPAAAPPAGSSIERLPGGLGANGRDTNDNASDWIVQAAPQPQGLDAPPADADPDASQSPDRPTDPDADADATRPTPTPTDPTPTPAPTPTPTPTRPRRRRSGSRRRAACPTDRRRRSREWSQWGSGRSSPAAPGSSRTRPGALPSTSTPRWPIRSRPGRSSGSPAHSTIGTRNGRSASRSGT